MTNKQFLFDLPTPVLVKTFASLASMCSRYKLIFGSEALMAEWLDDEYEEKVMDNLLAISGVRRNSKGGDAASED